MTVVYNDYYTKIENGEINLNNINFTANLVVDKYTPSSLHSPNEINQYKLIGVGALENNDILTMSMGEIIDKMKSRISDNIQEELNLIFQKIDEIYFDDLEKAQNMKIAISQPQNYMSNYWMNLRDSGVLYFVVQSPNNNCLCFCEDII